MNLMFILLLFSTHSGSLDFHLSCSQTIKRLSESNKNIWSLHALRQLGEKEMCASSWYFFHIFSEAEMAKKERKAGEKLQHVDSVQQNIRVCGNWKSLLWVWMKNFCFTEISVSLNYFRMLSLFCNQIEDELLLALTENEHSPFQVEEKWKLWDFSVRKCAILFCSIFI